MSQKKSALAATGSLIIVIALIALCVWRVEVLAALVFIAAFGALWFILYLSFRDME